MLLFIYIVLHSKDNHNTTDVKTNNYYQAEMELYIEKWSI